MDKHCANCIYRCYITAGLYCCDYIGYTGHARSLICPSGARCTEKKTVQRTPPNPNGRPKAVFDEAVCSPASPRLERPRADSERGGIAEIGGQAMTREEAIDILAESKRQNEVMRDNPSTFLVSHQMADGVKNAERRIAALNLALSALRPVSREQVERVRGEWINTNKEVEQMCKCSKCGYPISYFWSRTPFCPICGAPMTDEAVEMVMERWEELNDGKGD